MWILGALFTILIITLAGTFLFSLAMFIKQSFLNNSIDSGKGVATRILEGSNISCLKCGFTLSDEFTFCPVCGQQRLQEQKADKEVNISQSKSTDVGTTIDSDKQEFQNVETTSVNEIDYDLSLEKQNGEQVELDDASKDDTNSLSKMNLTKNEDGITDETYGRIFNPPQINENIVDEESKKMQDNVSTREQESQKSMKKKSNSRKNKRK